MKRIDLIRLAKIVCAGMFFVLLNGALVTQTDSGQGCGSEWPLCHGRFVPAYTVQSFIEYTHRSVCGIEAVLVVLLFYFIFKSSFTRKEDKVYISVALIFTVIQAAMGAMAVKYGQVPAVMALHYGFSLIAYAGTYVLVQSLKKEKLKKEICPPKWYQMAVCSLFIYCYVVIYLGAFVRHTHSAGGCLGWPLCNGQWLPMLEGSTGIAFIHRAAAATLFILTAAVMHIGYYNYPHLKKISVKNFALCGSQILSGGLLIWSMKNSDLFLFTSLLHTALIALFFANLVRMGIKVFKKEV